MAKHAAILIRVSTDAQKEHGTSLAQQRKDLLRLAKSLGYFVTEKHIYDDGGFSGSQLSHSERPGLSELIKAAERKEFEVAFVQYVDRFGRTTLENLITRDKLKKLGIVIHSYFEGRMENDTAGDLLFMFHSWKAEADNQQRKERSIRGRIAAAKNGKHCMGGPPFGYKRDFKTKKLTIAKVPAQWVRKFYHWCAVDGLSTREICRRANQLRAPLPGRRRKHYVWHRSSLHLILTNPAYTGTITFRRYEKNGSERPQDQWIDLSIPPIISRELFDRAQNRLRENKEKALRNTKRTYLYGGVIYCGYCRHRLGSGFQPARHKGLGTRYYHGLKKEKGISVSGCSHCPQVAEARLEPVWEAIKSAVTKPEYLRAKVKEYYSADKVTTQDRLVELEKQITAVSLQRKKILNIYLTDEKLDEREYLRLVHAVDKELKRVQEEKDDIERRVFSERENQRLSDQVSRSYEKIHREVIRASYETRRAIIKKIVRKILIFERTQEAEIELHLGPVSGNRSLVSKAADSPDSGNQHPQESFVSGHPATTGHKSTQINLRIKAPILAIQRPGRPKLAPAA